MSKPIASCPLEGLEGLDGLGVGIVGGARVPRTRPSHPTMAITLHSNGKGTFGAFRIRFEVSGFCTRLGPLRVDQQEVLATAQASTTSKASNMDSCQADSGTGPIVTPN